MIIPQLYREKTISCCNMMINMTKLSRGGMKDWYDFNFVNKKYVHLYTFYIFVYFQTREPQRRPKIISKPKPKPIEPFKLYLAGLKDSDKPSLPKELNYRKAITDFLKSMKPVNDFLQK